MLFFKVGDPAREACLEEKKEEVNLVKSCILYLLLGAS